MFYFKNTLIFVSIYIVFTWEFGCSKIKTPGSGRRRRGLPLYAIRLRGKRINVYGPNTIFKKE